MPTFYISKTNAKEIRFHALISILAIALIIFDTDYRYDVRERQFTPSFVSRVGLPKQEI